MVRSGKIHVNDIGTQFVATFKDTQIDPSTEDLIHPVINIAGNLELEFTWTKPDGTKIVRDKNTSPAIGLFTDGTDGKAEFTNITGGVASFVIDAGDDYWEVEGRVKLSDGKVFYTDKHKFLVRNNE